MKLKQAVTGMAVLACMTTAAHAQSAGSIYVTTGWFHLAPQSSSDPLSVTSVGGSPTNITEANTGASLGSADTIGLAAGSIGLIVILAFGIQQWQLGTLRSRWNGMAAKVHDLDGLQQQIRQFRPWYDDSLRGLTVLRQLTAAFPETGVVSAKTVEIRDMNTVTCTGVTQDNQALIKVLDQLRAGGNVSEVRLSNIRGTKPPLQFTFDFHWNEGGKSEN